MFVLFFLSKPLHFPLQLALSFLVTFSPTFSTLPTKFFTLSFPSSIAGEKPEEIFLFTSEPIEVTFLTFSFSQLLDLRQVWNCCLVATRCRAEVER